MPDTRPSRAVTALISLSLAAAVAVAVWRAPAANWDLPLLGVLLAFSVFSDLTAVTTASRLKISGSFLALVVAMVFLGGPPAALIGVLTIVAGQVWWRDERHYFLNNLLTYTAFPLVCGLLFHAITDAGGVEPSEPAFYLLVFGLFQVALAINFLLIATYGCYVERMPFSQKLRVLPPVLPSEFASAMLAVGVAFIYHQIGIASIALFGVVLITFQYLLGQLLLVLFRRQARQVVRVEVGLLGPIALHLRIGLDLHLAIEDLRDVPGIAGALVEHLVDEAVVVGHRGDADDGALPDVVLGDLGGADVEA
jgi:hypothetical protein